MSLVHARPLKEGDGKGADRGVDGLLYFYEADVMPADPKKATRARPQPKSVHREKIIVQIKGGGTGAKDIRDLIGTVENQKAIGGILITLDKPTKPMRDEAASAGRFESKLWQKDYPKIQIVTIEGLLNGTERIDAPSQINPFAMAAREAAAHKQTEMLLGMALFSKVSNESLDAVAQSPDFESEKRLTAFHRKESVRYF